MIAARRFAILNPVHTTNFIPQIEAENCNGCGKCVNACPVEAMTLVSANDPNKPKKKQAKLNEEICLGCGVCVPTCREDSLKLVARHERVITPIDSTHKVVRMAIERGKLQNLLIDNQVLWSQRALAAVLGGTQSLHTNSRDEALALPTEEAVQLALRTQQVIAHESGVAHTVDPLAGSYCIEQLTDQIEAEAAAYIEKIDELGGAVRFAPIDRLELALTAYTLTDWVVGATYRVLGERGTPSLAVGIHDIGLSEYVSPVGNGLENAWPDVATWILGVDHAREDGS